MIVRDALEADGGVCLPRIAKFATSERDLVIVGRHI
jgi:3-keto-L-gulonate-6-phosphate decarboxylase